MSSRRWCRTLVAVCIGAAALAENSAAFSTLAVIKRRIQSPLQQQLSATKVYVPRCSAISSSTRLHAAKGKKKRRRRKNPPSGGISPAPIVESVNDISDDDREEFDEEDVDDEGDESMEIIAEEDGDTLALPDIREARQRRKEREEKEAMELQKEDSKVKIARGDKEALRQLLEVQPFADADSSYFEEEEYDSVDAILGERAKSFLGIAPGPLQVGHFIGALGIFLMAYIEYPGFPLTNLPTAIRDCLQTGLFTVYAINTVLAVLAAFKAAERGLSVPLWVAKTFSVGGLAYDQLTQVPIPPKGRKRK